MLQSIHQTQRSARPIGVKASPALTVPEETSLYLRETKSNIVANVIIHSLWLSEESFGTISANIDSELQNY